jgi:hypothetical protein
MAGDNNLSDYGMRDIEEMHRKWLFKNKCNCRNRIRKVILMV